MPVPPQVLYTDRPLSAGGCQDLPSLGLHRSPKPTTPRKLSKPLGHCQGLRCWPGAVRAWLLHRAWAAAGDAFTGTTKTVDGVRHAVLKGPLGSTVVDEIKLRRVGSGSVKGGPPSL